MKHETKPLACDEERPLVTFALFAYNQEQFIREAVEGAFGQTYSPLEIILSDDCSKDRTFDIMEEVAASYSGKNEIKLIRNIENLGIAEHVNKVMSISSGDFIAFAAGDDISFPKRIENSVQIFMSNPHLMSVSLDLIRGEDPSYMDNTGVPNNSLRLTKFSIEDFCRSTTVHVNAPARMIRRQVYSMFGPLNSNCQVEDQPIMFRALLLGEIGVSNIKGVFYRVHGGNISAGAINKNFDFSKIYQSCVDDTFLASERNYIPSSKVSGILRAIRRRQKRDTLWRGYKNSPAKFFFFLFKILPSTVIPVKGKLRRVKELLS